MAGTLFSQSGSADPFLAQQQLLPKQFQAACTQAGKSLTLRYQSGYDHSYYFLTSFIDDHLRHHAAALT